MQTLLRILSFARPFRIYLPQYLLYTFLGVAFGIINLTLLKPLFDVIFSQIDPAQLALYSQKPVWEASFGYFIHWFYYYFIVVTNSFGKFGSLIFVCIVIIVANLTANLFRYLAQVVMAQIRARSVRNIRNSIFRKVSTLHLGFFSNERKGDIMSRITNDVQEIENSITNFLEVLFRDPLTIILSFSYMFWRSPSLTIFTLILLPMSGAIISGIAKRLRKDARESQESLGRIVNLTDELISGLRIIKAFNAVDFINRQFGKETKKYSSIYVSMAKKRELASPISEFLGVMFVGGILLYGGNLVLNNHSNLDASGFITYIIVFAQILTPAKSISKAVTNIQRGIASGDRIFKILDTPVAISDSVNPVVAGSFSKSIEFRNVNFSYDQIQVLKNINLEIPAGRTVALVGPSGGGKSTLADLIPRFYDVTSGELLLDEIDIKNYNIESVRKLMGIVTQESILFNDTIFSNIAFGLEHISEEDVIKAAKIANAHDFIMQTENGYQTNIGERGTKLSGGQRQRISIARAVLKNPPILILDEATSALDSESENAVQEAINNLMKNRTSIVIAHRLSTIQNADLIVVIQNGEITEKGTHEQLMQNGSTYRKMSEMQSF
jgi:subfamily B ATP-binding cassette protein MsbA